MRTLLFSVMTLLVLSGCGATWKGVKDDTKENAHWVEQKVNDGASYVKEKTEQNYALLSREMAEWSKAAVLKTVEVKASGGSNPSLPATYYMYLHF